MKSFIRDNAALAIVWLVLIGALASEGNLSVAPKFLSIMLLLYGLGMLLWSDNRQDDWRARLSVAIGLAIAIFYNSKVIWLYFGMFALLHLAVFLIIQSYLLIRRRVQGEPDDDERRED